MLRVGLRRSGLAPHVGTVISAHAVRRYKPSPLVYSLAPRQLRVPKRRILFVSANPFDAAGVLSFGLRVCWVNRAGAAFEPLGPPGISVADFKALLAAVLR